MNSIPVIVLTSKVKSRTVNFLHSWENIPNVSIMQIPGVYIDNLQISHDAGGMFQRINGRLMTLQELGCAEAHALAQKKISTSTIGGIIFEDDARFLEPKIILEVATNFLKKHSGYPRILNLCESVFSPFEVGTQSRKSVKLFGLSPLAVAYVLTPQAALELIRANNPITWVSDWPFSRVRHYVCVPALVTHGDEASGSEIALEINGEDIRNKSKAFKKLLNSLNLFAMIALLNKGDLRKFVYFNFLTSIFWRIDLLKTRVALYRK